MTTATFTSSGTWTCPAGVTTIGVACWGSGGSGNNGVTNSHSGTGGGGGAYAGNTSVPVTPGLLYSFTIGAGGSTTDTTFTGDSSTVVTAAHGVTGGAGGAAGSAPVAFAGGAGGSGHTSTGNNGGGGGGGSAGATGAGGTGGAGTATVGGSAGSAGAGGGASGGAGAAPTGSPGTGSTPGAGGGGGRSTSTLGGAGGTGSAGQITLTYTASVSHPGSGAFAGLGVMAAAWRLAAFGALTGTGVLAGSPLLVANTIPALTGTGSMSPDENTVRPRSAGLSGSGTMSAHSVGFSSAAFTGTGTMGARQAKEFRSSLAGSGSLGNSGITRGRSPSLSGFGVLSVLRVLGVITAGASHGPIVTPQAWPGSSQVAVSAPGSAYKYWLGTIGDISALSYSFVAPGGCDQMSCTVMVPAGYRTQFFYPGWTVEICRGGHQVWNGKLDEPVSTSQGWNLTATGTGNLGGDYRAVYASTWPASQPDQSINTAVLRGLPWVNPGVGTPSGMWLGQAVDSGAQSISDLLALVCTRGGLMWYVNSQPGGVIGNGLSVIPLPSVPNRLLVVSDPVARTLGGDINTIFIRYQLTADNSDTGATATYGTTSVQNTASVAMHGEMETYVDLSDAGVMTQAQAQAVGNYVLQIYVRATFAGPFTAHYGELLNAGGQPIDPGTDQAGTMMKLILTDFAFGGDVTPNMPVTFITGAYAWDDFAQTATVTPYQVLDQSISGLLNLENTLLQPATAAGG